MKKYMPHWIRQTHLYDPPEYECSVCGTRFPDMALRCPACESEMERKDGLPDWIEDAEEPDMIA